MRDTHGNVLKHLKISNQHVYYSADIPPSVIELNILNEVTEFGATTGRHAHD